MGFGDSQLLDKYRPPVDQSQSLLLAPTHPSFQWNLNYGALQQSRDVVEKPLLDSSIVECNNLNLDDRHVCICDTCCDLAFLFSGYDAPLKELTGDVVAQIFSQLDQPGAYQGPVDPLENEATFTTLVTTTTTTTSSASTFSGATITSLLPRLDSTISLTQPLPLSDLPTISDLDLELIESFILQPIQQQGQDMVEILPTEPSTSLTTLISPVPKQTAQIVRENAPFAGAIRRVPRQYRPSYSHSLSPIIVEGVPISHHAWAKSYTQANVHLSKATNVLFDHLFNNEEIIKCTLSGRSTTDSLSETKLNAIKEAVTWMHNNQRDGQDPYKYRKEDSGKLTPEEIKIVRKVFVDRRNERKRKQKKATGNRKTKSNSPSPPPEIDEIIEKLGKKSDDDDSQPGSSKRLKM